jgi:hypothetical protein
MMYFPEQKTALAVQFNTSAPRSTGKPPVRFLVELAEIIKSQNAQTKNAAGN